MSGSYGLLLKQGANFRSVPLAEVVVDAFVLDTVARVDVKQQFINQDAELHDATYVLALPPNAIVCDFSMHHSERVIKGEVHECSADLASSKSQSPSSQLAKLVSRNAGETFQINVGKVRKGTVMINVMYLAMELEVDSQGWPGLVIPRTIGSMHGALMSPRGSKARLNARLNVNVAFQAPTDITSFACASSSIRSFETSISGQNGRLKLACDDVKLDRDVGISFNAKEGELAKVYVERDVEAGTFAAMVTLSPELGSVTPQVEFVFVIDRRESMVGPHIDLAKSAMGVFLQSLPSNSYFNIMSFGSSCQFAFPRAMRCDHLSIRSASDYIEGMVADDIVGTDLYTALKLVYEQRTARLRLKKKVFVLTNGAGDELSGLVQLVRRNRSTTQTSTLGISIGDGCSRDVVEGVAHAGLGTADFIQPDQELEPIILNQVQEATKPGLYNLHVAWEFPQSHALHIPPTLKPRRPAPKPPGMNGLATISENGGHAPNGVGSGLGSLSEIPEAETGENDAGRPLHDEGSSELEDDLGDSGADHLDHLLDLDYDGEGIWAQPIVDAPLRHPPHFHGKRVAAFALFRADAPCPRFVRISADGVRSSGVLLCHLPVEEKDCLEGDMIHRLAAWAVVRDLEQGTSRMHEDLVDQDVIGEEIVETSCGFGIPSCRTVFVAVKEQVMEDPDTGESHMTSEVVAPPPSRSVETVSHLPGPLKPARSGKVAKGADLWRVNRKSAVRSFRIASRKLRFSVAAAKFKLSDNSSHSNSKKNIREVLESVSSRKREGGSNVGMAAGPSDERGRAKRLSGKGAVSKGGSLQSVGRRIKMFESLRRKKSKSQDTSDDGVVLERLLKLQSSDGSFKLGGKLAKVLGLSEDEAWAALGRIKETSPGLEDVKDNAECAMLWGTALAIAFLNEKLTKLRSEWGVAAAEAEKSVAQRLEGLDVDVDVDAFLSFAQQHIVDYSRR